MDHLELHFAIRNELSEIASVTKAIHEFSKEIELSEDIDFTLQLVAEELISNIVLYAYPEPGRHIISFDLEVGTENIFVRVQDDGIPFNLLEQSPPKKPESFDELKVGGLGIHLVRQMMDEITYRREDGHNTVTLKKKFSDGKMPVIE